MRDIDHGKLEIGTDLGRGEADAVGRNHGFEHVRSELADLVGDLVDGTALLAEYGIAVLDDGKKHRKWSVAANAGEGEKEKAERQVGRVESERKTRDKGGWTGPIVRSELALNPIPPPERVIESGE